jgi:hypothetical protein
MTHSYVKAICQRIETIRELMRGKQYCRMDDVSMMAIGLCLINNA